MSDSTRKTPEEWRSRLTPEQFRVAREGGTEPAFSGKLYHNKAQGEYACVCCGQTLFTSDTKYDSGSGWPSFFRPVADDVIEEIEDNSLGMRRIEIRCRRCDAHLGHVFPDGPNPTGLRYCVNSASLDFQAADRNS